MNNQSNPQSTEGAWPQVVQRVQQFEPKQFMSIRGKDRRGEGGQKREEQGGDEVLQVVIGL